MMLDVTKIVEYVARINICNPKIIINEHFKIVKNSLVLLFFQVFIFSPFSLGFMFFLELYFLEFP